MYNRESRISDFWIVGINYKKTEATIRGSFAINQQQYADILATAPEYGLDELLLLSTCNRTEVYGIAKDPRQLIDLLCTQTEGDAETFKSMAYIKNGDDALVHIFEVAAGIDSQILGDYEIVGQLKQAAKFAKKHGFISAFLERMLNNVLQSSKAIKSNTTLSGGTVSVSFAAVQYIKEHVKAVKGKNILLLGTGKIGRNTCKNLVDYLHTKHITLINRTEEKAQRLAEEMGLRHAPLSALDEEIKAADIILVATNATEPTILKHQLEGYGDKLIIDMSIPYNVAADVLTLPNVAVVNVDQLSKIKDETLQNRLQEVPKARLIIDEHICEFVEWYEMRKYVPTLKALKKKLSELTSNDITLPGNVCPEKKIQKAVNGMATKLRVENTVGCHYIEAINEFIA
ncbi:MAG: glutamyl-tRNA reductase [Sphingobacteriales bacterium]|nr:MAG: glutamyl-tRNA reductase [Sphingobacteriales bacterium]